MANLVPGFLFRTPGLNRNFTPIPNTTTPKDHDKINGRVPDPGRHTRASCTTNPHAHRICYDSVSLHKKPGIETKVDCLSSNNQKAHVWSPAQTAVNQKRHTSCKVPIDQKEFIPGMTSFTQRQHRLCTLKKNIIFHYPEMPLGVKLNLCNAERIYSSRNLLEQKRKQYMQLLIQKNRGADSTEYENYMRYINQSKTGPPPIKTGWRRPVRLPKLVSSEDSTNENSQKQQTPAEKTCPSSEVLQKSQSGQFENAKPESKREIKHELEKHESTKQSISIDQRVTGNKSHNRPSFLSSRNKPAISQTSSRLQQSTQREKDINLKEKPKDAIETGVEAKVHDKLQEEDHNPTHVKPGEAVNEMEKMSKVHDSRPSTVLSVHKNVERPESGMSSSSKVQDDQKPKDVKQGEASHEMDKTSNEHDSHLSAVLSVLGHVGRPESETITLSKGNGAEAQMNIDYVEYIKSKSVNKAESLVSIRSIDSQQIYRALGDTVDKDTDAGVSKYVHRKHRDLGGEDNQREGHKEIHQARSDFEETEDDNGGTRRGSSEIYGARRDSVETEDDKGQAKRVHENLQEEDQKSTHFEQRESADELNEKSQEHDSHPSTVDIPDTGQKVSDIVNETLQEEDKNFPDFKQRESADEMNKIRKGYDSNKDKVQGKLQEKEQKSKDLDQGKSADEMNITSQRLDSRPLAVERSNSWKSILSKSKSAQH